MIFTEPSIEITDEKNLVCFLNLCNGSSEILLESYDRFLRTCESWSIDGKKLSNNVLKIEVLKVTGKRTELLRRLYVSSD